MGWFNQELPRATSPKPASTPTPSKAPSFVDGFEDEGDFDDSDCWNCSGEGVVVNCFEEFACLDPDGGCDLCTKPCDVCGPRKAVR